MRCCHCTNQYWAPGNCNLISLGNGSGELKGASRSQGLKESRVGGDEGVSLAILVPLGLGSYTEV